uniref:Uncharacterized protein n=1 Tax=Molossus molossus TaxID=27622 RepID=A0A7J8BYK6_MOLMO|nr:hypothetical protein HJG59_010079 [Molossus molossus]
MAGRFFLPRHPVRGRRGGLGCRLPCEPGLQPLGACPDVGPHPGWPGEPAAAPCVPREAWEGGSLCPAHRELTHRAPGVGGGERLALGDPGTGNLIGGGGHRGPLARNLAFESRYSGVISQEGPREGDECGQRHRSG